MDGTVRTTVDKPSGIKFSFHAFQWYDLCKNVWRKAYILYF